MILLLAAAVLAAEVPDAHREAVEAYRRCVLTRATEFRRTDLANDPPSIVAYAAGVTCDDKRSDLLEKTKALFRQRHPELKTGGIGKVTALFISKEEAELERQVEAEQMREANAPNN